VAVLDLGQDVEVARLDRVVHEPKAEAFAAFFEAAFDHGAQCRSAQARDFGTQVGCDVHWFVA